MVLVVILNSTMRSLTKSLTHVLALKKVNPVPPPLGSESHVMVAAMTFELCVCV